MSEAVDYFSNHRLKLRFPWRLYHRPIVAGLQHAVDVSPGPKVLNVGSGPFLELSELRTENREFTICDIDARAIEHARARHGSKLSGADVLEPGGPLPYPDDSFDLVVSMEVVEHVAPPEPWLEQVMRVLRPGGVFYLTTPNYGSLSLRILEGTALEVIARLQGFSRKGLHPTPLDAVRLEDILTRAGAKEIAIEAISFGWVLAARGRKAERH